MTRVAVIGSVAAAGGFTAIAAWAQPGRSKTVVRSGSAAAPSGGGTGAGLSPQTAPTTAPASSLGSVTPLTDPPTTVAPSNNGGYSDGYSLSPPTTLPDPGYGYQYSGPAVVSGAS